MVAFALLSNISPSPLAIDLERWGYTIYEAVSFSEILYLCDYIKPAAVIVGEGVDVPRLHEVAAHHVVIEQHAGCTTEQLVEALTLLFGRTASEQ
jgi:hypothetical protein